MAADPAARARNQAEHWNSRLAAATTPKRQAEVWSEACRTVAAQAARQGSDEVWKELARTLEGFFRHYTT